MNISYSQFSNVVKLIANLNSSVDFEENQVRIHLAENEQRNEISKEVANKLTDFIAAHKHQLRPKDSDNLKNLKVRLLKSAEGDNPLIEKIQKAFFPVEKKNQTKKPAESALNPVRIVCELQPVPKTTQELIKNLQLVINHPDYTLSRSLAVIDLSSGHPPEQWSKKEVFEELKRWDEANKEELEEQQALDILQEAMDLYKPMRVASLSIVMQPDKPDLGAMAADVRDSIKEGLPTLTTIVQIHGMGKAGFEVQNFDVYIQKKGGLALLLPRTISLLDAGLNPASFELWEKPLGELDLRQSNGIKDLASVLLTNQENQKVRLSVNWTGHGVNTQRDKSAAIGGLSIREFQDAMDVLANKGMDFLWLSTCFAGGENMTQVSLPSGIVPCPTIVESSTDLPVIVRNNNINQVLYAAAVKLYTEKERKNTKPKQLTQKDMKDIGAIAASGSFANSRTNTSNLQSFLLPTPKPDVPHAGYLGFGSPTIMDVDDAVQHEIKEKGTIQRESKIEDTSSERQFYFFSRPVVSASLSNHQANRVGLLSRGGTNFHVIQGLDLPKTDLAEIVRQSVEARIDTTAGPRFAANKLFAVGSLTCCVKGKLTELRNVVIAATQKGELIAFKSSESNTYHIYDSLSKMRNDDGKVYYSLEEFCEAFYSMAIACLPSSQQLMLTSAGSDSAQDFFRVVHKEFWNENLPIADLCQNVILEKEASKLQAPYKTAMNTLPQKGEQRDRALHTALTVSIKSENLIAAEKLLRAKANLNTLDYQGNTLLGEAITTGNKALVDLLLKYGADPNLVARTHKTPLMISVALGRIDIVRLLLKHGGDPGLETGEDRETALSLAAENLEVFKCLTEGMSLESWNKPIYGLEHDELPLFFSIRSQKAPLLEFLVKQPTLLESKEDGLTASEYAILFKSKATIKKILSEYGFKFEITQSLENKLLNIIDEISLVAFQEIIKGIDFPLDKFMPALEKKIESTGKSKKVVEAIEYFFERGATYPLSKEAANAGVENSLAVGDEAFFPILGLDCADIYLKIKGGWKIDPNHEKMQVVAFHALNRNYKPLSDLLENLGLTLDTKLWNDPSWQQANSIKETDVVKVLSSLKPKTS